MWSSVFTFSPWRIRPAGLSDSSFHDVTFPSGSLTSTFHHACGLTFSSLVSVPVMVKSFCVSNSAFAEWCARAGAPIISSASAAADAMTIFLTMVSESFLQSVSGLIRRFLLHDVGYGKHDVRVGTEKRDLQVGQRLAVQRPFDLRRENHPDVRLEVAAIVGERRSVDVAVRLRGYRDRKTNQLGGAVRAQLRMLLRILDRDRDLDPVVGRGAREHRFAVGGLADDRVP